MDNFAFFCTDGGFFCDTLFSTYAIFLAAPVLSAVMLWVALKRNNQEVQWLVYATMLAYVVSFFGHADLMAYILNFFVMPFIWVALLDLSRRTGLLWIRLILGLWTLVILFAVGIYFVS